MPIERPPYAYTGFAKYLDAKIRSIKSKTEKEISAELQYPNINAMERFRTGEWILPFGRVALLAYAIDAAPAHIFRMAFDQHFPDLQEHLAYYFGAIATPNEYQLLWRWRKVTKNMDPEIERKLGPKVEEMLREVTALLAASSSDSPD